jgi:hypothetical protein
VQSNALKNRRLSGNGGPLFLLGGGVEAGRSLAAWGGTRRGQELTTKDTSVALVASVASVAMQLRNCATAATVVHKGIIFAFSFVSRSWGFNFVESPN